VLDASVLPYRREILALIEEERKKGRAIVLATASHRLFAERVAAHLNCFDAALTTEGGLNLVGLKKRNRGQVEKTRGRGYYPNDLEMISALGAASGYLSVMVLALYIRDPGMRAFYRCPEAIWLACPLLLFWITRIWLITYRREMHDDPVVFALRDRASRVVGLLLCAVFWIAV
jgi:hypothetical protein